MVVFSMSLLYALHSFGLGTCSLNTGYTLKQELNLRKAINLELNEEPIMMIAVGGIRMNLKLLIHVEKVLTS